MLHDYRLFHSDYHYLWKRIINVIFLRYHSKINGVLKSKAWFDLSTVPFPNPIKSVFISRRIDIWNNGRFHYNRTLFADKTSNLNNETLNVVYLDHVPSVVVTQTNDTNKVGGVEIEVSIQFRFEGPYFVNYGPSNRNFIRFPSRICNECTEIASITDPQHSSRENELSA